MDEKKYFDYLNKRSTLGALYRQWLLYPKLSRLLQGKTLDYGCGIGDFLRYEKDSVGVDINQFNINYCNSIGLDVKLLKSNRIPFSDNNFANVIMDNVIEHIMPNDVDNALHEILRVLEPKGRLLIGVPGTKGYHSDDDHKCYYSESDLMHLLSKHNCQKLKSIHMPIHKLSLQNYISQYCIYVLFESS